MTGVCPGCLLAVESHGAVSTADGTWHVGCLRNAVRGFAEPAPGCIPAKSGSTMEPDDPLAEIRSHVAAFPECYYASAAVDTWLVRLRALVGIGGGR